MTELSKEMVDRRLDHIANGRYEPEIPGLPDLVFVKMGRMEKGISSRAYSAKLKELMEAGGYFSEALLPTVVRKQVIDQGLDITAPHKKLEIQKRFFESVPEHLKGPVDKLTDEEVALLTPEEKEIRDQEIIARNQELQDFITNFYTDEDRLVFETCKQIENLESHLKVNTYEHLARKYQAETEIFLCSRKADDIDTKYFESVEIIQDMEDTNRPGLVQLYLKWKQFKDGMLPDYFRPDSPKS